VTKALANDRFVRSSFSFTDARSVARRLCSWYMAHSLWAARAGSRKKRSVHLESARYAYARGATTAE